MTPAVVVAERTSAESRSRWDTWLALASLVVLLAARWLQVTSTASAAMLTLLVLLLAAMTWRARASAWRRRVAFVVGAAIFVAAAGAHHAALAQLDTRGDEEIVRRASDGTAALVLAVSTAGGELQRVANAALLLPADAGEAFRIAQGLVTGSDDRAVVLAESGRPFAWAGRLVVPVDSLPGPVGVVATPFYIVAYAIATAGNRSAVATVLLHAEPPSDGLSRPLDLRVARATGVTGFAYGGAGAAAAVPGAVVLHLGGEPFLAARAIVAAPEALRHDAHERALTRGAVLLAFMVLMLLATAWRRDARLASRFAALAGAFLALLLVPLSALSNRWPVFDPTFFFVGAGGRFTANAGALAISSGLVLLGLLSALREGARPRSRLQALIGVLLVAGVGPFVLRELARGIQVPVIGASVGLWLAWQVTLFLAAVTVLLLGVTAGRAALGGARHGLPTWVAPVIAGFAALSTPLVLEAPGRLPALHPALWIFAIGALAFTRRARAIVLSVAFVAACGAVTLVWFSSVRERVQLAADDVQSLSSADPTALTLLDRFAATLDPATAARSRVELLARYAISDLAAAEYPTEVATWAPDGRSIAELRVGRGPGMTSGVNLLAREAQLSHRLILREAPGQPGVHVVLAMPHADGTVTTVVLAPRSALVAPDAFGAFLGFPPPPAPEPPYTLRLGELRPSVQGPTPRLGRWSRVGNELHGDWLIAGAGGMAQRVHGTVDLRSFDALVARGVLLVLLDLAMLGAVWLLIISADGALGRWWRLRRQDVVRSFRVRLSMALFASFVVPSAIFGLWSFQRVQADDRQSRDLLVRETLRGVAVSTDSVQLAAASVRFDTPLLLYADGLLAETSDPLLDALAPVGRLLPPGVAQTLAEGDEPTAGRAQGLGPSAVRLGYRSATDNGVQFVLAAPARLDERLLDRRRNDLAVFLLFALALGGLAALWTSGAGARQLSRPIRALQESALAIARGAPAPALAEDPPVEFAPVFDAFRTMTADLAESRAALETAERRLAATLRNVASGVVAIDDGGRVTFSNPRAESILGATLSSGAELAPVLGPILAAPIAAFREAEADDADFEVDRDGRRLQVRVARLARGARRAVITLDDVTDVARAERVLAWGEMARQVAHEIKNPLTPIRLGMQHLRRARRDGRVDFDRVLEENTTRVLAEIDRLDEIARAFSRYGTAPLGDKPAEPTDVAKVARDVLELERMGAEDIEWVATIPETPLFAAGRDRALREVLLNLLENARLARARRITLSVQATADRGAEITVTDDGDGIPGHLLDRIFEPHFSTRTSGSGLGLAISRRLIDGWGGSIDAESGPGKGTVLRVRLAPSSAH